MSDFIKTETRGHVLAITLNRPEARNAFNREMAENLESVLDAYEADVNLRAAVITAEGKTFSAGQDLLAAGRGEMAVGKTRGGFGIMNKPPAKPLIAAVEGQALAGGLELVLCCDLIVASTAAVFGLPEARRGLVALGGGCFRLPARLPYQVAMEMILLGEPRPAEEMRQYGLINRLVPPGSAFDEAMKLAEAIARSAPLAIQASKTLVARSVAEQWTDADGWAKQGPITAPVLTSADMQEGLRAFAEKREPVWSGS